MTPKRRQALLDWLVVGVPLVALYLATLQRDLGIIDSGELAAVSILLGVAHPTGYPIYSLLGRMTAMLAPGGAELPFLAGLSALAVVLACVLFVALLRTLLGLGPRPRRAGSTGQSRLPAGGHSARDEAKPRWQLPEVCRVWAPRLGGLVLGTSAVAWSQAVTNEVYGLHLLFVVLILFLGLELLVDGARERTFVLLAYVVGLSGGNHLSVVFLGPATLFALLVRMRGLPSRARLTVLGKSAAAALLGLTTLLYLPIRSARQPLFDWGNPETFPTLLRHVQGTQYRVWHFQSSERFFENCAAYLTRLPADLGWILLALFPWGVLVALRKRSTVGIYFGLVAFVTFVWASGYEIFDLQPYYLPADVVLIGFAIVGAVDFVIRLSDPKRRRPWLGTVFAVVVVGGWIGQAALRYPDVDRSKDHVVRFHLESVLRTVPSEAILLSSFWDAVVSPLLYLQSVEGGRTDVTVIDAELLRRSWYYPLLRRWDPGLLPPLETEVTDFLTALAPFESEETYDAERLERAYRAVIEELAHTHRPARATVFTTDLVPNFARGLAPIPEGLVYVLRDSPAASPELDPPDVDGLLASGLRTEDRIHRVIVDIWIRMMRNRVTYLERFGRQAEADRWDAELAKLMPYFSPQAWGLATERAAGTPNSRN